jgi:hypothetical protein
MTGSDSPVMADSETDASRSVASPSPDMNSPTRTRTTYQQGNLELKDFFTQGEFAELIASFRWRISRVFCEAPASGSRRRANQGYIAGLDDKIGSLAEYILRNIDEHARQKIYAAKDLPELYSSLPPRMREKTASFVRYELVIRQLVMMRKQRDLYYMTGNWEVTQSVLDEYLIRFVDARDSYENDANWHGRPRSARQRFRELGMAPGTSTGGWRLANR